MEPLNEIQPTKRFTAEWSPQRISFLDVTVSLIDGQIEADLDVNTTIARNTFILPRVILTIVRKAFRIVKNYALTEFFFSKNAFFDIHCNNLEKWLSGGGYSEKLGRKEILKDRIESREILLLKEKNVNK